MAEQSTLDGHWGPIRLYKEAGLDDARRTLEWCMSAGLIKSSAQCRRHRVDRILRWRSDRGSHFWYCSKCDKQEAVTKGSIFEDTNLPMGKALMLALCFAHNETYMSTARNLIFGPDEELLPDSTIARWFGWFREIVVASCLASGIEHGPAVGGPGVVVQIDEAQIGRRKYHRGRVYEDVWVFGAIDENNNLRMEICEDRTKKTLQSLITTHIRPGSRIFSDGWASYKGLDKLGKDYTHSTVNHSEEFVADDGTHTQWIESEWRQLRRFFHAGGRRKEDLADYLVEYLWRKKCLVSRQDPFKSLCVMLGCNQ